MRLFILILLAINLLLTFSLVFKLICEIKFNKQIKEYYDKQKQ